MQVSTSVRDLVQAAGDPRHLPQLASREGKFCANAW